MVHDMDLAIFNLAGAVKVRQKRIFSASVKSGFHDMQVMQVWCRSSRAGSVLILATCRICSSTVGVGNEWGWQLHSLA